jgi:hypothetical protein
MSHRRLIISEQSYFESAQFVVHFSEHNHLLIRGLVVAAACKRRVEQVLRLLLHAVELRGGQEGRLTFH